MRPLRQIAALLCILAIGSSACSGCGDGTGKGSNDPNGSTNSQTNGETNSNTNSQTNGQTNNCAGETDAELCTAAGAECGAASVEDRCGTTRDVICGDCAAPDTCTGNVCECVESDADFCARLMKDCGTVADLDVCGAQRSVECGACPGNEQCGADNVCGCPCNIDGQCVPDGMANPDNPCEVCDPSSATNDWSPMAAGSACDDGLACTANNVCDANAECVGDLVAGNCLIDGQCLPDGSPDPNSSCRLCDATADPEDWSDAPQGTACDDGLACTSNEVCDGGDCVGNGIDAGTCAIDDACYNQGEFNPNNPCEVCDPTSDQRDWSEVAQGTVCDDGLACTMATSCDGGECLGTIVAGTCAIDGVCYNQDEANPNSACELCDATMVQDDWSDAIDGTVCDDGLTCTANDACNGGDCEGDIAAGSCLIDDTCYADGAQHPGGRVCLTCDANQEPEDWSPRPEGTACDDGLPCTGDGTCNNGGGCRDGLAMAGTCAIDGACYMDGDVNPLNPCESCVAAVDNADWSARVGAVCDDGLACTSNDVCSAQAECTGQLDAGSCLIDAACQANRTPNPANSCEVCDPANDPRDWSEAANGTACDDGLSCTSVTSCNNGSCEGTIGAGTCAIDGACYMPGDSNPANECEICDPQADQSAWTPNDGALCVTDGDGLACTGICDMDQCVDDIQAGSCVVNNACYAEAAPNPQNECEVCSPTDDPEAFTPVADGTACGPNGASLCCAGTCMAVNVCQ